MAERIIKGGGPTPGEPLAWQDFEAAGRDILARARAAAEETLSRARAQAEETLTRAREQGFAQGRAAGHEEGRKAGVEEARGQAYAEAVATLGPALEVVKAVSARLAEAAARWEADLHADVLDLVLQIARKVIGRELELDPERVTHTVQRAVEMVVERHRLEVHVHPRDAALLEHALPEIASALASSQWRLVADETVDRGGAVVKSEHGEVDARIQTQLAEISRTLSWRASAGSADAGPGGKA